ncbi:MAG: response regulator [Cellvibrionaceae bacterium]|nr:response regulator [Cellvibrionaceae bacterium]
MGKINAIAQDEIGFIWFGGENGLARYDGYKIKLFQKSDAGLISSRINDIHVSVDGVMWLATPHGLSRYDAELESFRSDVYPGSHTSRDGSNNFLCLEEGLQRRLWLGGESGLFIYDRDTQSLNQIKLDVFGVANLKNAVIQSIVKDIYGRVWVATQSMGVIMLDSVGDDQSLFSFVYKNGQKLAAPMAAKLYLDNNSAVWLTSVEGEAYRFSRASNRFEFVDLLGCTSRAGVARNNCEHNTITSLFWDNNGVLYASSQRGLSVHYPVTAEQAAVEQAATNKVGTEASVIFKDKESNLWFGYSSAEVDIARRDTRRITRIIQATSADSPSELNILSATEGGDRIWFGTDRGLLYLEKNANTLQSFPTVLNDRSYKIHSLVHDGQRNDLWLVIDGLGLARLSLRDDSLRIYSASLSASGKIVNNVGSAKVSVRPSEIGVAPSVVFQDSRSDIWVASELGLARFAGDEAADSKPSFMSLAMPPSVPSTWRVKALYEDRDQQLWVASNDGLYHIDREKMTLVPHLRSFAAKLNRGIKTVFEDSQRRLWLSLPHGGVGLYDRQNSAFIEPPQLAMLSDLLIHQILEDNAGNLWFASNTGLFRYDDKVGKLQLLGKKDGLGTNLGTTNAAIKLDSGELLFATESGLTRFDPAWFDKHAASRTTVLTDFKIFNKSAEIGTEQSPIEMSITVSPGIVLSHKDSVVTFEFSALNYLKPGANQYAYRLQGRDSQWQTLGYENQLTFANLAPGNYDLMLKADNGYGIWGDRITKLNLVVNMPWWKAWWAYAVYLVLLALVIFAASLVTSRFRAYGRQKSLNLRLQELDKLKDEFLVNTSHELRMPVNGMVGVAEALKHEVRDKISKDQLKKIDVIMACGHNLFTLIDDILDYSQLTDGSLKLNREAVDLYKLIDVVFSLLESLVAAKPIILVNALSPNMPRVFADENRLSQVLINLVGNAIKFSEKGYITVGASYSEDRVLISVEDNGAGIAPERLETIFEPFHQLGSAKEGMGLGLYITQKLIHLHGGDIQVKSQGIGTEVLFDLELAPETSQETVLPAHSVIGDLNTTDDIETDTRIGDGEQMFIGESMPELIAAPQDSRDFIVLIVDDDPVNRMILQGVLAIHDYKVLEAHNGDDALKILEQNRVDLVILDVMMPGLSGYEACAKIREKYTLHQLPVIFLSARNSDKDLFNGYNAGGNEFIFKPVTRSNLLPKVAVQVRLQQAINAEKHPIAE